MKTQTKITNICTQITSLYTMTQLYKGQRHSRSNNILLFSKPIISLFFFVCLFVCYVLLFAVLLHTFSKFLLLYSWVFTICLLRRLTLLLTFLKSINEWYHNWIKRFRLKSVTFLFVFQMCCFFVCISGCVNISMVFVSFTHRYHHHQISLCNRRWLLWYKSIGMLPQQARRFNRGNFDYTHESNGKIIIDCWHCALLLSITFGDQHRACCLCAYPENVKGENKSLSVTVRRLFVRHFW